MDLGQQIKNKRTSLNLKMPKLAELLGIPEGRIYKWEKGTRPSDPDDYLKIKKWLESVPEDSKLAEDTIRQGQSKNMTYTTPITTSDRNAIIASPTEKDLRIADLEARLEKAEKEKNRLFELLEKAMQKS